MGYFVYILYSENFDRYYIGQTKEISTRLKRHNDRLESFTKAYVPWRLECVVEKPTRAEAMILERKLKNLNRKRILDFIEKYGGVRGFESADEA